MSVSIQTVRSATHRTACIDTVSPVFNTPDCLYRYSQSGLLHTGLPVSIQPVRSATNRTACINFVDVTADSETRTVTSTQISRYCWLLPSDWLILFLSLGRGGGTWQVFIILEIFTADCHLRAGPAGSSTPCWTIQVPWNAQPYGHMNCEPDNSSPPVARYKMADLFKTVRPLWRIMRGYSLLYVLFVVWNGLYLAYLYGVHLCIAETVLFQVWVWGLANHT